MSACVKCGHDPDAPVGRTWAFVLDRPLQSLNRHVGNYGPGRHVYRKEREAWGWAVRAAVLRHGITRARPSGKRRVTVLRVYTGRCREYDHDNLFGGAKPLVDSLVRDGVVHDDAREWLELHILQERGKRNETRVVVEELE